MTNPIKPKSPAPAAPERTDHSGQPASLVLQEYQSAYASAVVPCEIEPVPGTPTWTRMRSATFGDVNIASVANSPMIFTADRELADRNPAALVFDLVIAGQYTHEQGGRASLVSADEAVITHTQIPFHVFSQRDEIAPLDTRSVVLPERLLQGIGDISRFAGLRLTSELPEMRLLPGYLAGLDASGAIHDRDLSAIIGRHVTELVIAALARAMRREDPTEGRGIRAARLAAVKRVIAEQLAQPTLNAVRVARQLGVTERYVQMLLEESGTTFSAYVMEKRLQVARQSLGVNREHGTSIRDIAWASGFSDASHFTRAFRRRFGETPKAVRGGGAVEAAE